MIKSFLLAFVVGFILYFATAWLPQFISAWKVERKNKKAAKNPDEENEWVYKI